MINDPLGLVPRRRTLMLHSLLEATTEEERRSLTRMLNVLTATRRVIRKLTAGQKEAERRAKDQVKVEEGQRRTQERNGQCCCRERIIDGNGKQF
jgi:hypothetical protein